MNIIVVGCGRVGAELAFRLFSKGHRVSVVDNNSANFQNLNNDFRGRTIQGDAMNIEVLKRAGIESAHGLAAVTNSDTYNAVIAHLVRTIHNLTNVIVRNYNPDWLDIHHTFGFQTVSSSSWGAQRVEELLYHSEIRTVFSAGNGEVELYELAIPTAWNQRTISDLLPPEGVCPVALTRAGQALIPHLEDTLQVGDILLLSATLEGIEKVRSLIMAEEK